MRGTLSTISPDIFACTETWLQPQICDSSINASSYDLHRCDRPHERIGGGVAVYVSTKYASSSWHPKYNLDYFDCVWIYIKSLNLVIICAYVPHLTADQYCNISNCITANYDQFVIHFQKEPSIILCGDFNVFNCNTIASDLDIKNIVSLPTRVNSILD